MMRPAFLANPHPRDVLGMAMLAALAVAMLPSLGINWGGFFQGPVVARDQFEGVYRYISGPMTRVYLLMALGLLLCLRCGALDLSVWAVAGLGGVVAALCINGAWHPASDGRPTADSLNPTLWLSPGAGMLLGLLAGAAVGLVNGLLVTVMRLPSVVVTAATGMAIVLSLQAAAPAGLRQVDLPEETFGRWHLTHQVAVAHNGEEAQEEQYDQEDLSQPLQVTRMLLVTALFAGVLLTLLGADWAAPGRVAPSSRWLLLAAMVASGALAGAAGSLWLLDRNVAPLPTRLVDDLTPMAAALLAGGAFFGGRNRTLLAGVCLPAALLLATVWQEKVLLLQRWGYAIQTLLLIVMVLMAHQAGRVCTSGPQGRKHTFAPAALTCAGVAFVGASAAAADVRGRHLFFIFGMALWVAGSLLALAAMRRAKQAQ